MNKDLKKIAIITGVLTVLILIIFIVFKIRNRKNKLNVIVQGSGSTSNFGAGSLGFDHNAIAQELTNEFKKFNVDEDRVIALINSCPTGNDLAIVSDLFGKPSKDLFSWSIGELGPNKTLKEFTLGSLSSKEFREVAAKFTEAGL